MGTFQPGATASLSRKALVAVQLDFDSPVLTVLNGSDLIVYTNRDSLTGTTGEIPGQQYKVSTDVYFGDGLSAATLEPATDCTWTYDFTRL